MTATAATRILAKAEYGHSVAISGSVAVVGAPGHNKGAGEVEIFHRSGTTWPFQARITDPAHLTQDAFGWSVAVSSTTAGTYLAVGETSINGATNYVYVFVKSGNQWHLQAALKDPQDYSGSNFGYSVSITSSTLAIGTPGANNQYGVVYMYSRSGSHWIPTTTLVDPGTNYGDNFGTSVAISGERAIVSASNVAYIYSAGVGRNWARSAVLKNPVQPSNDFGWSASLSGTTAVVGAPGSNVRFSQGTAYVFVRTGSGWKIQKRLVSPRNVTNDRFGYAVVIEGNRVLVGAPHGGPNNGGISYEFVRSGSRWDQKLVVKDPSPEAGDQFGSAVSISGTTGIIGAPGQNRAYLRLGLS